jgi:hypothetical protein
MFKIFVAYYSWIPPKFEDLSRIIKLALKPICGVVELRELPPYSTTIASWRLPIEVETDATPTVEAVEAALEGLHIVEVELNV